MDPNANLAEQRQIVKRMLTTDMRHDELAVDGERLAELVQALDKWLSAGNFLPEVWNV